MVENERAGLRDEGHGTDLLDRALADGDVLDRAGSRVRVARHLTDVRDLDDRVRRGGGSAATREAEQNREKHAAENTDDSVDLVHVCRGLRGKLERANRIHPQNQPI